MFRATAIVACALALASCSRNEPAAPARPRRVITTVVPEDARGEKKRIFVKPVPDILDKSALGRDLAPDGTVAREDMLFSPGQPVSLTIWLKQSPPGLATSVKWLDAKDKVLAQEQHPMNGAKMTTFTLRRKLAPGSYHVIGYWGGNVVADKTFEVIGKK
jgi:hypothetical protein